MNTILTGSKLYNKIIDDQNIFNAIFSMESYVFDKGLLNADDPVCFSNKDGVFDTIAKNDLELYYMLADKHNNELIKKVISICKQKLVWIFSERKNIFKIQVFFKLKSFDEDKLKFRPLHTARLTDLICMVSILNCIMFEDDYDNGERKLSDLSKLIPHNFYGNIPSTDVQFLFHKWQTKYKEYTKSVVEHCRAYQKNHSFLTEICLDIKNFFPSISPILLYNYIVEKLSSIAIEDIPVLKTAVTKLLFFEVDKDNVLPWKNSYYQDTFVIPTGDFYMACGIPQGLPQSYFFGNLCMVEIKKRLMKKEFFNGDAYFYVDDSVIYIQAALNETTFNERIKKLNNELKEWCDQSNNDKRDIENNVPEHYLKFHDNLKYIIEFHKEGKSIFSLIDFADNQFGDISLLSRETSMASLLSWNLEDIDDHVTLTKLEALNTIISQKITELNERISDSLGRNSMNKDSSQLKLLKRFKKYFLYRYRLLKIREDGGPKEEMLNDFINRFLNTNDIKQWFNQDDEDIFLAEYRLLMQNWSIEKAIELRDKIVAFEKRMLGNYEENNDNFKTREKYLFYSKDAHAAVKIKGLSRDIYTSLTRWSKENYKGLTFLAQDGQMKEFRKFLEKYDPEKEERTVSFGNMIKNGFKEERFTLFVLKSSAEYQRRILNVYFSGIMGILPSDSMNFTKTNSRKIHYTELRILAFLRNKNFDLKRFKKFIENIDEKDVSNRMPIDMALLEVLERFMSHVRKPDWIDSLILTHRVTKGLWYNGSKFLNSYTLHNEEHAVALINKSLEITNRIDFFELKNIDYYILFLACYLHDISMVIHPDLGKLSSGQGNNNAIISNIMIEMQKEVKSFFDGTSSGKNNARLKNAGKFLVDVFREVYEYFEREVRDNHAKDSATFIRDKSSTFLGYLEPTLCSFVAKVSESHGYDVYDVYGLKSRAKDDTISIKYLMILIRLADLLDVANDRVNYHLLRQNLNHLSLTSKFHWISHLVTDRIELVTDYQILDEKKTKEDKLSEKPIKETINLNLYLNFKQLTTIQKKGKCKSCQCELCENHINIKIKSGNKKPIHECDHDSCTILCRWMMKKHDWLVSELIALNDYLFSVNNTLFSTQINFNIFYGDKSLDPDMFDNIQDYLED